MRNGWVRAAVYVAGIPLIVWRASVLGTANYERVYCGPDGLDSNDCWASFGGLEWAAVALCVSVALVGLVEAVIRRPSRRTIAGCLSVLALIGLGVLVWLVSLARIG